MDNNYSMNSNTEQGGYELDWGSSIARGAGEFVVLPEGDYDFEVTSYDRGRHNGSDKIPPCNKVTLQLRFKDGKGQIVPVRDNLFLFSTQTGKIFAFFESIGQKPDAQGNIRMDWNAVPGARGRARVGIRMYNGNQYNEIKRYIKPAIGAQSFSPAPQNYAAPQGYPTSAPQQSFAAPNATPQQNFPQVNTPTPFDGQQQTFGTYTGGKF